MKGTMPVPGLTISNGTSFLISKLRFFTNILAFRVEPCSNIDLRKALVIPTRLKPSGAKKVDKLCNLDLIWINNKT